MRRVPLSSDQFFRGFHAPATAFGGREGTIADGSRNQIRVPEGFVPWKGMATLGAHTGSRVMRQVGGSWGGIKDEGATQGKGSFFEDIGRSRWMIGAGQPHYEGTDMAGITLSSSLKVAIAVNGVYSAANTFTAGLPQPSAADIGIPTSIGLGLTGNIKGPVSVKIARLRLSTGARSVASVTSAVVDPQNQTVRVTFPLATTGQDYWAVFFTQAGFGGVGLHYRVPLSGSLDIAESTVAAGTVDGVARSLEFDFKDGDLVPEIAYIDDYVPPAGTHAVRLENVMAVLGAYADSTSPVSASNPGTVGAVSLANFYESYKPRHLIYFPESVVDVMARPTDQYAFVGHRDCITALQYVGVRDGPAVAVTMVSPDIGIAKPHNWCQVHGLLYVAQAKGGFVRMRPDGSWDYEFANPVRHIIKDWIVEDTVVGGHPDTLSVVYSNGHTTLAFNLQTEEWSPLCYLRDAEVSGTVLSCVSTVGRLIITIADTNGSQNAHAWNEGAIRMPISTFSQWRRNPRPSTIMEMLAAFETDTTNPVHYSIHRNLRRKHVTDGRVTSGHDTLESTQAKFDTNHTDTLALIFGESIGSSGDFLLARLTYVSPTLCNLVHPTTGAVLNANATAEDCYVVLAHHIGTYTPTFTGQQHTPPLLDMFVGECQSHCVGLHTITAATAGGFNFAEVQGTQHGEAAALTI